MVKYKGKYINIVGGTLWALVMVLPFIIFFPFVMLLCVADAEEDYRKDK